MRVCFSCLLRLQFAVQFQFTVLLKFAVQFQFTVGRRSHGEPLVVDAAGGDAKPLQGALRGEHARIRSDDDVERIGDLLVGKL